MPDNKFKAKGFLVWGVCALFFLYEFFLRTVVGTYQCPLMHDLKLTSFQFSLISTTIFLLTYGVMQIPVGLVVNSIGLKKSLIMGAFCCAISSICFAYSHSYMSALICRLIMGFGASFGFICLLISVREWMPYKYSGIFIGLSQFLGTLGPMAAAGPLESISTDVSWRIVFLCLSIIGIFLTFLIFFFVEENQQESGKYIVLKRPEKMWTSFFRLLTKSQPWLIAILSTSLYFSIEYLSENEGRAFLLLKGVSKNCAAYMLSISWVGYAIGCPLLGFFSDILERRKIMLKISALVALVAIVIILFSSNKLYLQISFFLLGIGAGGQSIGFATMAEHFKRQFVAIGFGLNNAVITTVSAINAPLIGLLLDYSQKRAFAPLDGYFFVFNILIAMIVIALVIAMFFIKETYCKSLVDFTILKNKRM